jgi:hypothetical protein
MFISYFNVIFSILIVTQFVVSVVYYAFVHDLILCVSYFHIKFLVAQCQTICIICSMELLTFVSLLMVLIDW